MNIIFLIADHSSSSPTQGIKYLASLLKQQDAVVYEIVIPNSKSSNIFFRLYDEIRFARKAIKGLGLDQPIVLSYGIKLDLINAFCSSRKRVSSVRGELRSNYLYSFGIIKGFLYFWIHWIVLMRFKAVVVMSKYFEKTLRIPKKKITVIPNLFDFSSLKISHKNSQRSRKKSSLKLITCGSPSKLKGVGCLTDIFSRSEFCNSKLDWYGSRNHFSVGNTVFYKSVPTNKIPYGNYDAYLSLSYSEGHSRAILEALTNGLPVICRNIPGNFSLHDEFGVQGLLFFTTEDDLNKILQDLLSPSYVPESSRLGTFESPKLIVEQWVAVFMKVNIHG